MSEYDGLFPEGIDLYRVQTRTKMRAGIPLRVPRHFWNRTHQAEWDGCMMALRGYTRNGLLVKVARAHRKGRT